MKNNNEYRVMKMIGWCVNDDGTKWYDNNEINEKYVNVANQWK